MRTQIKVTDLNLRQWDFLITEVPVDGRTFLPGLPRVCVEFELTPDFHVLHIEMDVAEFAGLVCVLEGIKNETIAVAQAALTPDALPDSAPKTPFDDLDRSATPGFFADRDGLPEEPLPCGHHNPPHFYDCQKVYP